MPKSPMTRQRRPQLIGAMAQVELTVMQAEQFASRGNICPGAAKLHWMKRPVLLIEFFDQGCCPMEE